MHACVYGCVFVLSFMCTSDNASMMRQLCVSSIMFACVYSFVCVLVCKSMYAGVRT